MGVTGVLTAISVAGSVIEGMQSANQAKENQRTYEAQAANIAQSQKITAEQYRAKANALRGEATTTAARGGLKISGSVANSISQSIMQLQMDNSYEQYNLEAQKQQAYDNARAEKYKGRFALIGGLANGITTALSSGSNYYNKYWKNTGTTSSGNSPVTWVKGQSNKIKGWGNTRLSGGLATTNSQIVNSKYTIS